MSIAGSSIPRLHINDDDDDDSSLNSEEEEQERLLSAKFGEATVASTKRKKSATELEAEEAKELLKKKRKPRPKLTASDLKDGLIKVRREFPRKVKYRGRGDEARFSMCLISNMKDFCFDLFPHAAFEDVLDEIQKLGSSERVVKDYMQEMRKDVRREFLTKQFGKERATVMLTEMYENVVTSSPSPQTKAESQDSHLPIFIDGDVDVNLEENATVSVGNGVNGTTAAISSNKMTSPTSVIHNPYNKGGIVTQQSRLLSSRSTASQVDNEEMEAEFEPDFSVVSPSTQNINNNVVNTSEATSGTKNANESRGRRTIESSDEESEAEFDDDLEIVGQPSNNADKEEDEGSLFVPVLSSKKESVSQDNEFNQSVVNNNAVVLAQDNVPGIDMADAERDDNNHEAYENVKRNTLHGDDDDDAGVCNGNDEDNKQEESVVNLAGPIDDIVADGTQISQTQTQDDEKDEDEEPYQSLDY